MTKEQIIERLLQIREDAVYSQIAKANNDSDTNDWHFYWGREDAVCQVLNELDEAGDLPVEAMWSAFERGRERGWAERKAKQEA